MRLWNAICLTQGRFQSWTKMKMWWSFWSPQPRKLRYVTSSSKYRLIKRPGILPGSQEKNRPNFVRANQVQLLPHTCTFHELCDSALQGHSHPSEASESIAQSLSQLSPSCVFSAVTFMSALQRPLTACTGFFIQCSIFLNQPYSSRLIFTKRLCCTSCVKNVCGSG